MAVSEACEFIVILTNCRLIRYSVVTSGLPTAGTVISDLNGT